MCRLLKTIGLFCKRALDHILQKRPMILRSLLIIATPQLIELWCTYTLFTYTCASCHTYVVPLYVFPSVAVFAGVLIRLMSDDVHTHNIYTHEGCHTYAVHAFVYLAMIFIGLFPQKSPIINGFFAERDLRRICISYVLAWAAVQGGNDAAIPS